ncbi:hypothetical protein BDZ91DRAFT_493684 [Kalaharituber pfeilii]|nr:hypothetical protein BDZ91DRAFT_493684 [Kalaharituber pfeilii]
MIISTTSDSSSSMVMQLAFVILSNSLLSAHFAVRAFLRTSFFFILALAHAHALLAFAPFSHPIPRTTTRTSHYTAISNHLAFPQSILSHSSPSSSLQTTLGIRM